MTDGIGDQRAGRGWIQKSFGGTGMHALAAVILMTVLGNGVMASELDDALKGYRHLQGARDGSVLVVKFYNPPTNLMNRAMVTEIRDLLTKVDADGSTRVLVFTGGVPNMFIQHYDVSELSSMGDAATTDVSIGASGELHAAHLANLQIETLSKPCIAAINGQAHGGGFELALACDFRIMTDPGTLGLPEVNVGILPGAGGTVRLPRLIGVARAKELIMLGQVADARTAVEYGMVMKAVPVDQLMPEALRLAKRLESLPPQSLALTKQVITRSGDMELHEALKLEEQSYWALMRSEEARRLMRAYVKRNQGNPGGK